MLPLLRALHDGQEHSISDVRELLAKQLRLSDDDRRQTLPSGKQALFDNRLGWAKTYIQKAGLLRTIRRGVYQITSDGQELLSRNPTELNNNVLEKYPGFRAFTEGKDGATVQQPVVEQLPMLSRATPEESLQAAYGQLRRQTERELLEHVIKASPAFFEQMVVDLLVRMGYGGSIEDAGKALGRSGDGGIDGLIKEDPLGLDAVYIQAKRWQANVGRPDVQAFAGSLEGERARKGVLITTSDFSREAREYVARIDKRIVLVDGQQLAALMFDHGIGVVPASTFHVKRVDNDYFDEE
jgi:restriction system protein